MQGPCTKTLPSKRFILLRYLNHLELWKLGRPIAGQDNCNSLMLLSENQSQLLQLKAKDEEYIISASISEDGQIIAYSTSETIRFFKFIIVSNIGFLREARKVCNITALLCQKNSRIKNF